ncbi:hypothetical protein QAD02_008965 [Eretmocerus hayati]|uniref:Uncharacterized protein n=1 Tax=Eretmocerus hayati TaxID=131215 RepID=A0ACC2N8P7_9HYME|nr:hypothetical protein QAD02_008965 [Eretmocerus hayati]
MSTTVETECPSPDKFSPSTEVSHQTVKIYNTDDFDRVTKGIKVAQCMRIKSALPKPEELVNNLEELIISDSLSCSFCNTVFEDKTEQRLHYKLDWHRFNLKQKLHGLKSVTEDSFKLLADKDDVSSISGSEAESQSEVDTGIEISDSPKEGSKFHELEGKCSAGSGRSKNKKCEKKIKVMELKYVSSDEEDNEDDSDNKDDILLSIGARHSKVFFENDEGNIFSIYRCLLHSKKEVPEIDNELIAQALDSGKKSSWTILMVGGGHFAGGVFYDGNAVVHKTFHCYTVRAKQGSSQSSRDNRNASSHPKSAGASIRRYNEASLIQHVQEILETWSPQIKNSSLILYRAVGPFNRTVLFGGKNAPIDKNDPRLRPLPFPTRRATFSEVKRVYDILSNMEIYGSAENFTDSFPISPRQPLRKRTLRTNSVGEEEMNDAVEENDATPSLNKSGNRQSRSEKSKMTNQDKQSRNTRPQIDRAKMRKSPKRPLPDIVAKLARSSSESEFDVLDSSMIINNMDLISQDLEINFEDHLQAFENTVPKNKRKLRQQKRKMKKSAKEDANS